MSHSPACQLRHLVVVLGDQLDRHSTAFEGFDPACDAVWMAEVAEESTHVWTAKPRIAIFLSAMRHFARSLVDDGIVVHYRRLDDPGNRGSLAAELAAALPVHAPQRVRFVEPGEYRVREAMLAVLKTSHVPHDECDDFHFLASRADFVRHARGRRQLRMEFFYRDMRQRHRILMEDDGKRPLGGQWNFDAANRGAFGRSGPDAVPEPLRHPPDETTREVIALVNRRFADHPGQLDDFAWPVTRSQALATLQRFIDERLSQFGRWQDAMWTGEPWLWHAHVSSSLNLKLLNPREVIAAAETAYRDGRVPIESAEGFIRQILGWREFVRGVYWLEMPDYLERNALGANEDLPAWYWTGATDMACLADAIGQTLRLGYAHHIQRLMVTGLFALLYGTQPRQVHEWYLAVYVDAVEWVELPNTLGMSQYGDGGLMASKPYVATGKYIQRMSNLCAGCRYDPGQATGDDACPFTTLYWDFLARHEQRFADHPRMKLQVANLARRSDDEQRAITARAAAIRSGHIGGG